MSEWEKLSTNELDRATEIHGKAIVIDTSNVPKIGDGSFFERAERGGVTASNTTMLMPWDDLQRAIEHIAQQYMWLEKYKDRGNLAVSTGDIDDAKPLFDLVHIQPAIVDAVATDDPPATDD